MALKIWQKDNHNKPYGFVLIIALLTCSLILSPSKQYAAQKRLLAEAIKPWDELTADPQYSNSQSCRFYTLKTENGSLAALVLLDLNDRNYILKPFFNQRTGTVSSAVKEQKALAGINGGFFNLSNGESTSYVVIDGKDQCDPRNNKALVENPELKPYLETIFNRSELRILEDSHGKRKACISLHKDPIPSGWTLLHSLQAGPTLLPKITDDEEIFIRKSSDGKLMDSIGAHKKAARTAIGITHDNHILLLCVANKNQDEFSSGVTLEELANMLRDLGCTHAINCDGGTSTTMVVAEGNTRDKNTYSVNRIISGEPEKLVKSGLIIQRTPSRIKGEYSTDLPR